MKTINKMMLVLTLVTLVFTACNTKKEKEYNLVLNDGTSVFYNNKDEKAISIDGWKEFNTINQTLIDLENINITNAINRLEYLNEPITNLSNTLPSSLKTEEVLEDIRDIQEEYTKLINEKNKPLKNVKQNLEELKEKFDDLREELNETVEDYIKE